MTSRFQMAALAAAFAAPATAFAVPVTPVDLADVDIGATIVGPVGPTVDVSLVDGDVSWGDLTSSVSCPAGFAACVPPANPAGTIYTYRHTVIPAVDLPNDPPFPAPDTVVERDSFATFSLDFAAAGFNGVAGYDFAQAAAAIGDGGRFDIELTDDGALVWSDDAPGRWGFGDELTFFWQTTQPPSGPSGLYSVTDEFGSSATGNGPLPRPVEVTPVPVNEPGVALLAIAGLAGVGVARRRRR